MLECPLLFSTAESSWRNREFNKSTLEVGVVNK